MYLIYLSYFYLFNKMDKDYSELINYFNSELKKEPEKKCLNKKESPFKDICKKKDNVEEIITNEDDEINSYYYKHNANDIFIPKVYAINSDYESIINDLKATQDEIFKIHETNNNIKLEDKPKKEYKTETVKNKNKLEDIPKEDLKIYQEYYDGCKEIEISETYALKGGYLAEEILEALSY